MKTKPVVLDRGVYRLAAAVLLQAILDAGSSSMGRRTSALRWINSKDESCYSFTFICRVLSRDPEEVRRLCERKAAASRKASFGFRDMVLDPGRLPGLGSAGAAAFRYDNKDARSSL